jgi:hypothetical protein
VQLLLWHPARRLCKSDLDVSTPPTAMHYRIEETSTHSSDEKPCPSNNGLPNSQVSLDLHCVDSRGQCVGSTVVYSRSWLQEIYTVQHKIASLEALVRRNSDDLQQVGTGIHNLASGVNRLLKDQGRWAQFSLQEASLLSMSNA